MYIHTYIYVCIYTARGERSIDCVLTQTRPTSTDTHTQTHPTFTDTHDGHVKIARNTLGTH